MFLAAIYSPDIPASQWASEVYNSSFDAANQVIRPILTHLGVSEQEYPPCHLTQLHIKWASLKVRWEDIRIAMQARSDTDGWAKASTPPDGCTMAYYCSTYLITFISDHDKWYLMDYEQVMLIADTISSRFFTLIHMDLLLPQTPGKISSDIILTLYKPFDNLLVEQGNLAYESISCWESIVFACILNQHDPLICAKDYYKWRTDSLTSEGKTHASELLQTIESLNLTVDQLCELHGLYRHWGHPTVDEELGCKKVKEIALSRPMPNPETITPMLGLFKRQFVISFLGKHGRWPRCIIPIQLGECALARAITSQYQVLHLYSPEYPLEHWAQLQFEQEFEFDYHLDYTDLIDDKSLSVERDQLRTIYSSEALGYQPGQPRTSRRCVRELLRRETIDIKEICDIIQLGLTPDNWKIVVVHAKEREMKLAPRLFAMMTLEMRLYFCVTEQNLSKYIFSYFPQQTMTLDEADLSKRLLMISRLPEVLRYLMTLFGVDYSKWNISWCSHSTHPFFVMLDELFGTPGLYSYTHRFFSESLVALASYHNPPVSLFHQPTGEPAECETLWYNHRGGFEGLRQKGWTLVTIAMLLLVEHLVGMKSYIVGQGDNQICRVHIPKEDGCEDVPDEDYILGHQQEIKGKVDQFMNALSHVAEQIGLTVKKEETWVSSIFLIYGKEMLFRGAYTSQASKRISRTLTDVNEVYPTLHTKISSLFTAGMAACQKSHDWILPYIMCAAESLVTVCKDASTVLRSTQERHRFEELRKSGEFLVFLLLLSTDVGSFPAMHPLNFMYRGHPDHLTAYTTFLQIVSSKIPIAMCLYVWLSTSKYTLGQASSELLVSNPCSTNIYSPPTFTSRFRYRMEQAVRAATTNRHLREVFHLNADKEDSELFDYLASMEPCAPRLMHEIYRQTPTASRRTFIAKFSNTRTTQALMTPNEEDAAPTEELATMEVELVKHWLAVYWDVMKCRGVTMHKCPTHLAQEMRSISWRPLLENRTITGVTIPHPLHQFASTWSNGTSHTSCAGGPEYMSFSCLQSTNPVQLLQSRGPYPAYIGSLTREKISGKIYMIPQASRPLRSAERIIQLSSWCVSVGGTLEGFLRQLIEARTNIPIEVLQATAGVIVGGSVTHRLDDHVTKRGTLNNFRPNITTNVYFSSDEMGRFSRGVENYNMHFQGIIHTGFSQLQIHALTKSKLQSRFLHLHYKGICCEERVTDVAADSHSEPPTVSTVPSNPLLYADMRTTPFVTDDIGHGLVILNSRPKYEDAVAAVLLARATHRLSLVVWGLTETSSVPVTPIGVREIKNCNIHALNRRVATLLLLLTPDSSEKSVFRLRPLVEEIWREVAQFFLLKEMLPAFCLFTKTEGAVCGYLNDNAVAALLSNCTFSAMRVLVNKGISDQFLKSLTFFSANVASTQKMMRMWVRLVELHSHGRIKLQSVIRGLFLNPVNATQIPTQTDLKVMYKRVQTQLGSRIEHTLRLTYPIRISSIPAEVVLRGKPDPLTDEVDHPIPSDREFRISTLRFDFRRTSYPLEVVIPTMANSYSCEEISVAHKPEVRGQRTRADHSYRLFGSISTAFNKVMEICLHEDLNLDAHCVCLAEGEGSVAYLLQKLSGHSVYFNTLVDSKKLIPQRASSYTPAACMRIAQKIKLASFSALNGGDITDPEFLVPFCEQVPPCPAVVTCDAESTTPFSLTLGMRIVSAWCYVCTQTKSAVGIIKLFCNNTQFLMYQVGMICTCFQSVKIVVPHFSSHEGHEIYVYAKTLRGMVPPEEYLQTLLESDTFPLISSYISLREPLHQLLVMRDKLRMAPFGHSSYKLIDQIWRLSCQLEYPDNLPRVLDRLTLGVYPFPGGDVNVWLTECQQLCSSDSTAVLRGHYHAYSGQPVSYHEKVVLGKRKVIHESLDKYATALLNVHILRTILGITRWEHVYPAITDAVSTGLVLKENDEVMYVHSPELQAWSRQYLKAMWRAWGHYYHRDAHQCTADWTSVSQVPLTQRAPPPLPSDVLTRPTDPKRPRVSQEEHLDYDVE